MADPAESPPVRGCQHVVTSPRARERDRLAPELCGLGPEVLMERAALETLALVRQLGARRLVVLAGPGNNGGDALALARLCGAAGLACTCLAWTGPHRTSPLRQRQLASLAATGQPARSLDLSRPGELEASLAGADLLVDGLFGLGLDRPLEGEAAGLVRRLAQAVRDSGLPVLALDLPSGLFDGWQPGDPVLPASQTLCFDRYKSCLFNLAARPLGGKLACADIGIFLEDADGQSLAVVREPAGLPVLPELGWRDQDHKFRRGQVQVFAGSVQYAGAGLLAARGARAGCPGLVQVQTDAALVPLYQAAEPSLIVWPLEDGAGSSRAGPGCGCAGPGWGDDPGRRELLAGLLAGRLPLVLDAQALRLAAGLKRTGVWPAAAPAGRPVRVLTPHAGELADLAGISPADLAGNTLELLAACARDYGAWLVLKGGYHAVADPAGRLVLLDVPVPGLAQAGSGDIFAGFLASQLALAQARLAQAGDGQPVSSGSLDYWTAVVVQATALWLRAGLAWQASGNLADQTALLAWLASLKARDHGLGKEVL